MSRRASDKAHLGRGERTRAHRARSSFISKGPARAAAAMTRTKRSRRRFIGKRDDAPTRPVVREPSSVKRSCARAMRQGANRLPRGNPGEAKSEQASFTGLEHRPLGGA